MHIHWDQDRQNILLNFDTPWQWKDFVKLVNEAHEAIRQEKRSVNMIIWHQVEMPSDNIIANLSDVFRNRPPNVERIYIVISTPDTGMMMAFFMRLAQLFERTFPGKTRVSIFRSFDELTRFVGHPLNFETSSTT